MCSIVGLFSVIAAVPAILVAIVASITLDRGLDRIFNIRTRAVIENSLAVTEAYLRDHAQIVRADIVTIATDIARAKPLFDQDRERFRQFLTAQASLRGLAGRGHDRQESGRGRAQQHSQQPGSHRARPRPRLSTSPRMSRRSRLIPDANYVAAIIKLRNFTRYLSLHRPRARSARGRAIAGNARERVANTRNWNRAGSACRSRSA